MKHHDFYTRRNNRRQKVLDRCRRMREAKERKRMSAEGPAETTEAGRVTFSGLFGEHTVRLLARSDDPLHVDIEVDGRTTCSRTVRGAKALLMRRIAKGVEKG